MKIYLTRHGESHWQLGGSEDLDSSLTPLGHQQSVRLGGWLAAERRSEHGACRELAALQVSPLRRARETAAYAAEALGIEAAVQDSLREASFHVADHLPRAEAPLESPASIGVSPDYEDFKLQADAALKELVCRAEAVKGPVLAITHGGLIKTLLRRVVESDAVCFRVYNTGLTLIEWRRGRWHLSHLNLCDHLPAELRTE